MPAPGRRRWKAWRKNAICERCRSTRSPSGSDTWQIVPPPGGESGVYDIHSGAAGTATDGQAYSDW